MLPAEPGNSSSEGYTSACEQSCADAQPLLPILNAGPWISAGGRLNYEHWPERERFVQLDALIQKQRDDYYDRLSPHILCLHSHGLKPGQIAQRLCMKPEEVLELIAEMGFVSETFNE